jgi:hypothetical protein
MNLQRALNLIGIGFAVVLFASCAGSKTLVSDTARPARVWPAPPDELRIKFVKSISTPSDIGRRPSAWKRATAFLVGGSAEHVNF